MGTTVGLAAAVINDLIKVLPTGTAYCIGMVLVVMMTGRQRYREGQEDQLNGSSHQCRHPLEYLMAITGARWRLDRAGTVLRIRALRASGDFDEYWEFHKL